MSFWGALVKVFRRKKVCVYVALDNKALFRATGKLQEAGIPYQTRIPGLLAGVNRGSSPPVGGSDFTEYEIYVKREHEEKARSVLGTYSRLP